MSAAYVVHVLGPDDVLSQPDRRTAYEVAHEINARTLAMAVDHNDEMNPTVWAVVRQAEPWEVGLVSDETLTDADPVLEDPDQAVARIQAAGLQEAADAIQALHPGETKASVTFLRDRADAIESEATRG